ncbi:MAG: hypothetical protein H7Y86_03670 [Rhizobacter sp.]|nr:hypothetical protein [Ferruginibacter sp.]
MKVAAFIFLGIVCFLVMEPLVAAMQTVKPTCSVKRSCKKTTPVKPCKKNTSNKPSPGEESKDCNPFMGCSLCNLFLMAKPASDLHPIIPGRKKIITQNDNRLMRYLSECWHPPNAIV